MDPESCLELAGKGLKFTKGWNNGGKNKLSALKVSRGEQILDLSAGNIDLVISPSNSQDWRGSVLIIGSITSNDIYIIDGLRGAPGLSDQQLAVIYFQGKLQGAKLENIPNMTGFRRLVPRY